LFAHLTSQELVNLDAAMLRAQTRIAKAHSTLPRSAPAIISTAYIGSRGAGLLVDVTDVRHEVNAVAFPRL
jgi:hypothetical protein